MPPKSVHLKEKIVGPLWLGTARSDHFWFLKQRRWKENLICARNVSCPLVCWLKIETNVCLWHSSVFLLEKKTSSLLPRIWGRRNFSFQGYANNSKPPFCPFEKEKEYSQATFLAKGIYCCSHAGRFFFRLALLTFFPPSITIDIPPFGSSCE